MRAPGDPERPVADNYRRLAEYISNDNGRDKEQVHKEQGEEEAEVFEFDDYKRLADYMADGSERGETSDTRITERAEKLHSLWIENCKAGNSLEFLDMAIAEIEVTQDQNTRAKSEKTYHLLVSFRKEDAIPSKEVLKDMEQAFAKALGYEEHQRVVACHQDTDNFHFHVAYNRVHPGNFKCHSPSWDYYKRDAVCREMEKKHGLAIDNGVKANADQEQTKTPTGARDMEAHRWEESFDGYVRRHKDELLKVVDTASNWQDVHEGFEEYNLDLKKQGNGLIIASKVNKKHRMKASSLDRGFSKASLETRFGAFQAPEDGKEKKAKDSYKVRPTTKHKGQDKLWKQYRGNRKAWHKGWKSFLYQLALVQDPLAMAIIQGQKMLINSILPSATLPSFARLPRLPVSPVRKPKPQKPNIPRMYLSDISHKEKQEAKRRGARWDAKKRSWYAGSKEALFSLSLMRSSLVQEKGQEERKHQRRQERFYLDVAFDDREKAKNAGARWDNNKKSWYAPKRDTAKEIVSASIATKSE